MPEKGLCRLTYLAEVPDQVSASLVHLTEHVEEEGVHVVVQRLVVQEQLGQQAQVLAVHLWTKGTGMSTRFKIACGVYGHMAVSKPVLPVCC